MQSDEMHIVAKKGSIFNKIRNDKNTIHRKSVAPSVGESPILKTIWPLSAKLFA